MAENNERLLMFTFWGAYLKEDYKLFQKHDLPM